MSNIAAKAVGEKAFFPGFEVGGGANAMKDSLERASGGFGQGCKVSCNLFIERNTKHVSLDLL
jgi:hypothetical protein